MRSSLLTYNSIPACLARSFHRYLRGPGRTHLAVCLPLPVVLSTMPVCQLMDSLFSLRFFPAFDTEMISIPVGLLASSQTYIINSAVICIDCGLLSGVINDDDDDDD